MSGKSQTIWDFTVSRPSHSKSLISLIVWDQRVQIWRIGSVSIFPTHPRLVSAMTIIPNKWKLKFVPLGTSAMDLLITNPLNCWNAVTFVFKFQFLAHFPFPAKFIIGNLGQASGKYPIYPQNLGWSTKSKIPDRLGFSWHMKTRL